MTDIKRFSPNIPIGFIRGTTVFPDPAFLLDLNTLVDRTGGLTGAEVVTQNAGIQTVAVLSTPNSELSPVSAVQSATTRLPTV